MGCKNQNLSQFFRLQGYYSAKNGLKPQFRDYLSVPSSRLKLSKKKESYSLEDGTDR
jgi:hypothetical protein